MAKFSKIKAEEAPQPSPRSGKLAVRMRQFDEYVQQLEPGQVGKLVPEQNETARGLALRVSRAAKRMQRPVMTWIVKDTLYFAPAEE